MKHGTFFYYGIIFVQNRKGVLWVLEVYDLKDKSDGIL